ncbi:ABC transporter permease [Mesoplasma corruscae]|uniref:ABC transporter permease n=1 Tax=Mesoplasma corruscae TaxID=216874 RepID=A0A2S5RGF2_9MOLU|nr:ABC transporter permease [Mesoplasma corruscae]PPE06414.1 ABC transporter permease [Mesoplasma corruscae]
MKKSKNYLLLKQGKKGIFRFKVQFLIIIILAFLSVFILTSSINLRDRLNKTYNDVVRSVDKFDYYQEDFTYGSGFTSNQRISQKPVFTSIDINKNKSIIDNEKFEINIAFNEAYYGSNFITNSFKADEMKSLFTKLDANNSKLINDESFRINSRNILVNNLYNEVINQKINSPVAKFLKNDVENLKKDQKLIIEWKSQNKINFDQLQNINFYVYATTVSESIMAYFAYFDEWLIKDNPSLTNSDLYTFVTGNQISGSNQTDRAKNWIVNDTNQYSTDIYPEKPNLIEIDDVSEQKIKDKLLEQGLRGISNPIFKFKENGAIKYSNTLVEDSAFRLEPSGSKEDWSAKISGFETWDLKQETFKRIFFKPYDSSENSQYSWILNHRSFSSDDDQPIAQVLANAYNYNLKIASFFANLEVEVRREFNFFDNISQIQYRGIILDEQTKTKTKILNSYDGGRVPIIMGEVLVSEQFARAHKLKLNDNINIGTGVFNISGFATDTLSYYPIADEDLPVPQYKKSALIYATASTFETMRRTNDSNKAVNLEKVNIRNLIWSNNKSDVGTFNKLYTSSPNTTSFDESGYAMSWTLQPLVVLTYTVSTMFLSLVLMLVAIIGLVISTKKTIKENSKQIGILKALGFNSYSIASSYIAQALFVTIFIIPVSWVVGLVTQSIYIRLFIPYFSIELHQVQFSITPLIIAYVFLGLLSVLVSFYTAYKLTNKPIQEIIKHVEEKRNRSWTLDKINNTMLKKSKFSIRFSVNLASTNKRNIVLMTVIVLLSSFMVSIGLSIPATIQTVKDGYYKNVNYANSYDYVKPVSNAPLSKGSVVYVTAPEVLDKDYKKVGDNYIYSDPKFYFDSTYDSSPIAKYMYLGSDENSIKIQNTFKYLSSDFANESNINDTKKPVPTSLIGVVMEQFGNNFAQSVGQQFSVGTIEQIMASIIHSVDGSNGDNKLKTDDELLIKYKKIADNLTKAIPLILSAILGVSQGNSSDWKESIVQTISKAAPPFIQAYIQDPSRIEQYAFGYNAKRIVKDKETFATKINVTSNKYNFELTGLNKHQQAFNIDSTIEDKVFLDDATKEKIVNVFDQKSQDDIYYQGLKIYDANSNELFIPTMTNHQSSAMFKKNKSDTLSNIKSSDRQLSFETSDGSFKVLPKDAWVYDDNDFLSSDYFNKAYGTNSNRDVIKSSRIGTYKNYENKSRYLNLQDLDNNKFTFRNFFDQDGSNYKLTDSSYLFNDFAKDSQKIISYIRPYYEYKNVNLFIPKSMIKNDIGINGENKWANYINKGNADLQEYFKNTIKSSEVPDSVKNAWKQIYNVNDNDDYVLINPYALEFSMQETNAKNRGLLNLTDTNKDYVWYSKAINAGLLKEDTYDLEYTNNNLKINLLQVGKLDSYNGNFTVVDQTFANLINNYSTIEKYAMKNDTLGDEIVHKAGEELLSDSGKSFINQYDRYSTHDETKDIYVPDASKMWADGKETLKYTQMMWNNSKFSNIAEPTELTTGFVTTNTENNGILLLSQDETGNISSGNLKMMPEKQKLLTTEKQLIAQVTQLAVSIAMLIIVSVIIMSALLIILIADIYITKYRMFMILMKSFGYSNWKVMNYSFGPATILSLLSWIGGTAVAWGMISLVIFVMRNLIGIQLPFVLTPWPIYTSFIVIVATYLISVWFTSLKVRTHEPAEILKEANE